MRRARLEGRHIGRTPLELDHAAIHRDRSTGHSLREIAKNHRVSTATVQRALKQSNSTTQEQVA
jgi:transposase